MPGNFGLPNKKKDNMKSMDDIRQGLRDIESMIHKWFEDAQQQDGVDQFWLHEGRVDMTKTLQTIGRSVGL